MRMANNLAQLNGILKDQLDQANQAYQSVNQEVSRVTLVWRQTAQQLDRREAEWREEETAFNEYFAAEHSRLLTLWRVVVSLRRQFSEMRLQTERDLSQAQSELTRHSRSLQSACGNLAANLEAVEVRRSRELTSNESSALCLRTVLDAESKVRVHTLTESLSKSQMRLMEAEARLAEVTRANEKLSEQNTESQTTGQKPDW
ncbi:unnamed protein product [Protopolystoma xenopodis]|uniref:Rootletin-like coiled-coil domain-containing protein n=1 Tax=Protopolystoma xenopodis TaxID=117903 RepID=A0A448XLD6_9PLAT|nr:unnamed protein product [Protopolystoma xenopodis]